VAAGLTVSSPATAAPTGAGLELVRASPSVTLDKYPGSPVYFDVGAYVASVGGSFRLNVTRAGYRSPIAATQVLAGGGMRPLPAWAGGSWDGLRRFVHYAVRDASGQVVASLSTIFCLDGFDLQRVNPSGPFNPTFPEFCGDNPFTLGAVWGIDRGWAVGLDDNAPELPLRVGHYSVTISIPPRYAALFRIPAAHARTTIAVNVVKAPPCCAVSRHARPPASGSPTIAPAMTNPKPSTEPDLVALPSWGISTQTQAGRDYLDFGATVWDHGPAPMDIEGFRRPGTGIMDAYQYFFKDGRPIGRAKVGILEYDPQPGHEHWHFQQFVRYSLLNSTQSLVVRSQKDGFCLAPTDAIDLVQHGAVWNPGQIGLAGACGDQTAVWTRESLPSGWGDTYEQTLPGQSFDITGLPNGTYYVSVQANPLGAIHEVRTNNDTSLRKVILGGTPGKRTVRVPAWNGIDPEG
jgi:hypothetical protein